MSRRQPGDRAPERTVLGLIKDLQAGTTKGTALPARDRRRVVEHLWAEGYSVPEIAEVVGVTERTIARDRQAIRQANALEVHDGLVPEMVGALLRQAEVVVSRLRRISRDREAPAVSRVDAELGCWQVHRELVETLQRLGYLPSAPHELRASLSVDHAPEYAALQRELERVGSVVGPEFAAQVTRVRETIVHLVAPTAIPAAIANGEPGRPSKGDPAGGQEDGDAGTG